MRSLLVFMLAFAAAIVACTGAGLIGGGDPAPVSSRLTESCGELAAVCGATGRDCLARSAFCGAVAPELAPVFSTETACKTGCDGDVVCLKSCKVARVDAVVSILSLRDLNLDGTAGDGLGACPELSSTCTTTGDGCSATEFFCSTARPATVDPCSTEFAACREACGHDRTCKRACRATYLACESGSGSGTTPDAGTPTPDAPPPPPPPDAPTTTTLTYTANIKPVADGLCNGCHSGNFAPQNYFTDSYQGLFGNGSDNTPNIIPFDASSKFVLYMQGNHKNVLGQFPGFDTVARDWVVRDGAPQ